MVPENTLVELDVKLCYDIRISYMYTLLYITHKIKQI